MNKKVKKELFNLCQYLAASAERLKDEPKDYGPLRLLETLSRLAKLVDSTYDDPFLKEISKHIDEKSHTVMTNKDEFYDFIQQLVLRFTKEAKNRSSQAT